MNCPGPSIVGADVRDVKSSSAVAVGGVAGCNRGKRGDACGKDFGKVQLATYGDSHAVVERW